MLWQLKFDWPSQWYNKYTKAPKQSKNKTKNIFTCSYRIGLKLGVDWVHTNSKLAFHLQRTVWIGFGDIETSLFRPFLTVSSFIIVCQVDGVRSSLFNVGSLYFDVSEVFHMANASVGTIVHGQLDDSAIRSEHPIFFLDFYIGITSFPMDKENRWIIHNSSRLKAQVRL